VASDFINPGGFGKGQTWSMANDAEWAFIEGNPAEPITERILAAAYRRVNWWGHAPFHTGQLKRGLGVKGVNTIGNAIKSLISRQRIAPESTTRCIVLSIGAVRRQYHGRDESSRIPCQCPEHIKKNLRDLQWMRQQGWEPAPGFWDKLYAEDEGEPYGPLAQLTGGIELGGPQQWVREAASMPRRRSRLEAAPVVTTVTVTNNITVSGNSAAVTVNANMPVVAPVVQEPAAELSTCGWRQPDGADCGVVIAAGRFCEEHKATLAALIERQHQLNEAAQLPSSAGDEIEEPEAGTGDEPQANVRLTRSKPARIARGERSVNTGSYTGWDGQEIAS
jgi:hypothetical protein